MLFRRILPFQIRTYNLWEFDPAKHQILQHFFGVTHEGIWKVLFKANETWPKENEDRGYNLTHPASPISFFVFSRCILYLYTQGEFLSFPILFFQGWTKKAELVKSPAPLPEDPAIPLLTRMLVPTPYQAPKKKAKGTRGGLRHKGTSDVTSEDAETHLSVSKPADLG